MTLSNSLLCSSSKRTKWWELWSKARFNCIFVFLLLVSVKKFPFMNELKRILFVDMHIIFKFIRTEVFLLLHCIDVEETENTFSEQKHFIALQLYYKHVFVFTLFVFCSTVCCCSDKCACDLFIFLFFLL